MADDTLAHVTATNPLSIDRRGETLGVRWSELLARQKFVTPERVRVFDSRGQSLVCQAVDEDGDLSPDILIWQADFAAKARETFRLCVSDQATPPAEPRAFGRYVPERLDDFAWENDRLAFRMYGPALEEKEPTGSGIDVWMKRTRLMVINPWYKSGDYHTDRGQGLDCYSVGPSRGCGGSGIWRNNKLYASGHFRSWRQLANGPIRVSFELTYSSWKADGATMTETKRVTLDAGQQMNQIRSAFTRDGKAEVIEFAVGLANHQGKGATRKEAAAGWVRLWEDYGANGEMGAAVVMAPAQIVGAYETGDHLLLTARTDSSGTSVYYTGAAWTKAGDIASTQQWDDYLASYAQRLAGPIQIAVK